MSEPEAADSSSACGEAAGADVPGVYYSTLGCKDERVGPSFKLGTCLSQLIWVVSLERTSVNQGIGQFAWHLFKTGPGTGALLAFCDFVPTPSSFQRL